MFQRQHWWGQHGAEHNRGRVAGLHCQQAEADVQGGKDLNKAIQDLLPSIVKESKKILFSGNNYDEKWHKEAELRGLPNLKSTPDVLPVVTRKDTIELFTKYKVYTEKELQSRFNILSENYVKQVTIEAKTAILMAKTISCAPH